MTDWARRDVRLMNDCGICFQCGKLLLDALRRPIRARVRMHHGNQVKLHAVCAETFDREQAAARITAQPKA